jgi:hypothetical protein
VHDDRVLGGVGELGPVRCELPFHPGDHTRRRHPELAQTTATRRDARYQPVGPARGLRLRVQQRSPAPGRDRCLVHSLDDSAQSLEQQVASGVVPGAEGPTGEVLEDQHPARRARPLADDGGRDAQRRDVLERARFDAAAAFARIDLHHPLGAVGKTRVEQAIGAKRARDRRQRGERFEAGERAHQAVENLALFVSHRTAPADV